MTSDMHSLMMVFKGWDGYQVSLVDAVAPLSREQLTYRPAPHLRTAGQIALHISNGRLSWFLRTFGIHDNEALNQVASWRPEDAVEEQSALLVKGPEATWRMVADALQRWSVDDLARTYPLSYQGKNYALPRQWVLWRIMAHDLHHGGELAVTLGLQGIAIPELGGAGGHITEPPLAEPT